MGGGGGEVVGGGGWVVGVCWCDIVGVMLYYVVCVGGAFCCVGLVVDAEDGIGDCA